VKHEGSSRCRDRALPSDAFADGAPHPGAPADPLFPPDVYDEREGYCRQLGHYVRFDYCRRDRSGDDRRPCGRIADCWFERIPVEDYLRANYTPGELEAILAPPPPKVQSILEIVARVRAETGSSDPVAGVAEGPKGAHPGEGAGAPAGAGAALPPPRGT
jgi:hypothetical protein